MTRDDYLKANTVLFWLVALIAAGIILIGVRFIVAPFVGATGFGVPPFAKPMRSALTQKSDYRTLSDIGVFRGSFLSSLKNGTTNYSDYTNNTKRVEFDF